MNTNMRTIDDLLSFISACDDDHHGWAMLKYNFKVMGGR